MKKHILYLAFFALMSSTAIPALAQEAPPPRKMPRVPVHREAVQDHKPAAPATREVQGQVVVVDGERLRMGDMDMRLFGVVPPQLSASFGPQARAALDELTTGQNVTCLIRDRDREERFLATCHNANNADLALELLKRGLAVTARGSIASTDLAMAYIAAEQAAEAQKVGLWSMAVPAAAAVPETPKAEAPATQAAPPVRAKTAEEKPVPAAVNPVAETAVKAPVPAPVPPLTTDTVYAGSSEPFLARYQLLVTGLIMLMTALGVFGAIAIQRLREKRAEMQALAAALRGELMAAHAICRARLRSSMDAEDKDITWPRLRSTLYQAYVGRVGWLGAELARRVASIYGQANDYATYYADGDETRAAALPKRQALQTLVQHIDDVLPRLAIIEHTGNASSAGARPPRSLAVVVPLPSQQVQSAARAVTGNASTVQTTAVQTVVREKSAAAPAIPAVAPFSYSIRSTSPSQIWTTIQKFARTPWSKRKPVETGDPIAEYTALIEEEMKRFSFLEEEDESDQQLSASDTGANAWAQKAHEAF